MSITKARQLAEFIANADVDSDEIATGAVSASKLAATLDLSSKTIILPDLDQAVSITSNSSAEGIDLLGRSSDNISQLTFKSNDDATAYSQIQSRSSQLLIKTLSNIAMSFYTNNVERMRIDNSGNVQVSSATGSGLPDRQTGLNVFGGSSVTDSGIGTITVGRNSNSIAATNVLGRLQVYSNDASTSMAGVVGHIDFVAENSFSGTAQTAITFSTNNSIAGSATERVRIDADGNVGIGTDSPGYKLQVDHGTGSQYASSIRNTNDNLQLLLGTTTGGLLNIQGKTISSNAAYQIALQAEGGNVGIGTASPNAKLEVIGGNGNQLYLDNAGERFTQISLQNNNVQNGALWLDNTDSTVDLYANTGHGIRLKTGGDNPRLTVTSDGNVGIGEGSPDSKLHIRGDAGGGGAVWIQTDGSFAGTDNASLNFRHYDDTGNPTAQIKAVGVSNYTGDMVFSIRRGGTSGAGGAGMVEALRLNASGGITFNNDQDSNLNFFVKSGSVANAFMVDGSSGNVGIGTASPTNRFHVDYSVSTSSANLSESKSTAAIAYAPLRNGSSYGMYFGNTSNSSGYTQVTDGTNKGSMLINPYGGNVGVGTTSASVQFQVGAEYYGTPCLDIMKVWRSADLQGYKNSYPDGGSISYTWYGSSLVKIDTSVGSHNWDIGEIYLDAGTYFIIMQYRPSPDQHGWNVYGTNSNGHSIRLQSNAGYGSYNTHISVYAQLHKDDENSRRFRSGTYTVTSAGKFRIGMSTQPYVTGGYKCWIESAYLMKMS